MNHDPQSRSILFVCMGNICRSPAGEAIFLSQIHEQGIADRFKVDSAGMIGYHAGNPADERMWKAAAKRDYQLNSRSRLITESDLETFDLVIAMDRENFQGIRLLHEEPTAEIKLLSDFLDDSWPTDVPDPYYGGEDGFEYVLDMLEAAMPGIFEHLKSKP